MPDSARIKSRKRVAEHGEVFTPAWLVSDMCDLVAAECERIESRFLEPACGNGNFLAEVLRRKLATCARKYKGPLLRPDFERASIKALMSIYGVELLADNVEECRERLYQIWNDAYSAICGREANDNCRAVARFILKANILCGNALSMTQADGGPIIFAEWAFISDALVKRRDFRLDQLILASEKAQAGQIPMGLPGVGYDQDKHEFIPLPLKDYPPADYRSLHD